MLGSPILYFKGMRLMIRLMMFQLSGFYCKPVLTTLTTEIVSPWRPFLKPLVGALLVPVNPKLTSRK